MEQVTTPPSSDTSIFQALVNGFFQAEGFLTIVFSFPGINVILYPVIGINQLYSKESIAFFIRIGNALGRVGIITLYINSHNNLMISYRLKTYSIQSFYHTLIIFKVQSLSLYISLGLSWTLCLIFEWILLET